jgi:hypothetical protein
MRWQRKEKGFLDSLPDAVLAVLRASGVAL